MKAIQPGEYIKTKNSSEAREIVEYLRHQGYKNPNNLVGNSEGRYGLSYDSEIRSSKKDSTYNIEISFDTFKERQKPKIIPTINNYQLY